MPFTKILVPIDFSEHAERALAYAVSLSEPLGASLHVVYVAPVALYLGPPLAPGPAFSQELHVQSKRAFDEYMRALGERKVRAKGIFAEGIAYVEINRTASDIAADLIVMGTHGRTGIQHALLGSVAERVVRTSSIPVLVVPAPSHASRG